MEETWDATFRDLTRFWVQFVLVPVVVSVGLLGNSATIMILTKRQSRLPSNVYLTTLAFSDLLFLIFSFSMSWKHYDFMKSQQLYWNYIPFGLWITDASSSISVWLTDCFTIERYIAICQPTLLTSTPTIRRAKIVSTIVYVSCSLLTLSTLFEWKTIVRSDSAVSGTNDTIFSLSSTALGLNPWYRLIYHWFSTIVFVFVPLAILAIGNLLLINAVRASRRIRSDLISCYVHRRQAQLMRQEDRITTTLIIIIIVFLLCQMPTAVVLIYTSMHAPKEGSAEENVLFGLGNIFNLLVAVNASCNFMLYTAISDKYRKEFSRIFCCAFLTRKCENSERRKRTLYILPDKLSREERLRQCENIQRQRTLYILPDALSLEERLRYVRQQCEMEENAIVCSNSDAFKNLNLKNVVVLRKCATCTENEKRACSFEENARELVTV